tara:strand:- start:420 stop:2393 length:1974 start_codon:yes stop_codon:yes gene_type:complete
MEAYTGSGWGSIATPPTVTGISPSTVAVGDTATQVFTVTGTGITNGSTVQLEGADGTLYDGFNVTTPNATATQITFKMGALGTSGGYDVAQKPYKVKINVTSGLNVTSTNTITFSPPTITSLSNNTLTDSTVTGSTTITVNGTGFTSSMTGAGKVMVLGADGSTLYAVNSVAVASTTQLTFNLGASLSSGQLANRPYKVRVTGASGLAATSTQTIGFAGLSWSSPASNALLEYEVGTSSTQNLIATDEVGGSDVTFTIFSGSVSGLSLGSASASPATYGGNATTDASEVPVTFRVTDNVTGSTLDRTFRISASSDLYPFISHTFTTAGRGTTGATYNSSSGPRHASDVADFRSSYNTVWDQNSAYYSHATYDGYQLWTVPSDGIYLIQAKGARGGYNYGPNNSNLPGKGGVISAKFTLTRGQKLVFIVGQPGHQTDSNSKSPGGGGATWVIDGDNGFPGGTVDNNWLYMVAGGGGGAQGSQFNSNTTGNSPAASQGNITAAYGGSTFIDSVPRRPGGGAGWLSDGEGLGYGSGTVYGKSGGFNPHNSAKGGFNQYNYVAVSQEGGFGGGGSGSIQLSGGGAGLAGGNSGSFTDHNGYNDIGGWIPGQGYGQTPTQHLAGAGTQYIMPNGTGGVTVTNRTFDTSNNNGNGEVYVEKMP